MRSLFFEYKLLEYDIARCTRWKPKVEVSKTAKGIKQLPERGAKLVSIANTACPRPQVNCEPSAGQQLRLSHHSHILKMLFPNAAIRFQQVFD